MGQKPRSPADLIARYEAWLSSGKNVAEAARRLGLSEKTVRLSVKQAEKEGNSARVEVPPGYEIKRRTEKVNADGSYGGESVAMVPTLGDSFDVQDDHSVKGVSALVDPDGHVIQKWIKTKEAHQSPERIADAIVTAFDNRVPSAPSIQIPDSASDGLFVYAIADWHLGAFA